MSDEGLAMRDDNRIDVRREIFFISKKGNGADVHIRPIFVIRIY